MPRDDFWKNEKRGEDLANRMEVFPILGPLVKLLVHFLFQSAHNHGVRWLPAKPDGISDFMWTSIYMFQSAALSLRCNSDGAHKFNLPSSP